MIRSKIRKILILVSFAISSFGLVGSSLLSAPWSFQEVKKTSMDDRLKALGKKALEKIDEVEGKEVYTYPYLYLEDEMLQRGEEEITIFAYGSLMGEASAIRTLSPSALHSRIPALAFGAKRLFNRDLNIKKGSRYAPIPDHSARGVLNLELTHNYRDIVNGVVFRMNVKDIAAMLDREEGYDLVPILYTSWDDFQDGEKATFDIAYTLRAKALSRYTNSDILPRPGSYELISDAAKEYGEEFYRIWLSSTYHADGVTLYQME
jgi:hypothetical protein